VSDQVVREVLVAEWENDQISTYCVSYVLARAKFNYPLIKKFAKALVMANTKLRPYFKAHKIIVLTDQP